MNAVHERVVEQLRELEEKEFWGYLNLKLERGQIVQIRREEYVKPKGGRD